MVFQFSSLLAWVRRIPRWRRLGISVLLGFGISILFLSTQAEAAQSVLLVNRSETLTVPISELRAIANQEEPSEAVKAFIQEAGYDVTDLHVPLTTELEYVRDVEVITPRQFLLLQVNKTLGDPLRREDLDSLEKAFRTSLADDGSFSIVEILEHYPAPVVRLDVNSLERVYRDIDLFVTRMAPVLSVAEELLPELICDCNGETAESASADTTEAIAPSLPSTSASEVYTNTKNVLENVRPSTLPVATLLSNASPSAAVKSTRSYADKELVFTFGPLGRSISVGELTTLAETGETSRKLDALLKLGNVNPTDLQKALNTPIKAELANLDRILNGLLGEYLLFEVGQVIHTQSRSGNIQALRSTLILSVAEDDEFTAIELLQNYPTSQIYVDGVRLARFGRNVKRFRENADIETAALSLEDWLVQVQVSAAEDVCTCDTQESLISSNFPISPAQVAAFTPTNWQPVPSHREDYGIIKVVWLQGTPYEMGYQHGELLHDELAELGPEVMAALRLAGRGFGLGRMAAYRSYPNVIEECRGLADATQDIGMTPDACMVMAYGDVFQELFGHTLPEVLFWDGCSQFVATGEATKNGRLYHGSTLDNNKKPIDYIVNNPVVFIRQPATGLPHVFFTYPGMVWPNWGLNVAGVTMGLDTAHSTPDEIQLEGRSNVQIMAKVLENATSFEEARTILETEPRVRGNLIMVADGRSRQAGVFEFTGKNLAVRELQDNGVLYTTNHFVLEKMHDRQPLPVGISSELRFARYRQLLEPGGISSDHGQIDVAAMVRVLRDRTHPETMESSPPDIFDDDASPGGNGSLRQAVYEPESLRFWVAAGPPPVPKNPFVCFSLGEMLGFPNAAACEAPAIH